MPDDFFDGRVTALYLKAAVVLGAVLVTILTAKDAKDAKETTLEELSVLVQNSVLGGVTIRIR
jgi:hypothetical protein